MHHAGDDAIEERASGSAASAAPGPWRRGRPGSGSGGGSDSSAWAIALATFSGGIPRSASSCTTSRKLVDRLAVERLLFGVGASFDLVGVLRTALPDRGVDRAGLDDRDRDAPGPQLLAEDVADRLDPELGGVVGAVEREGDAAADRGDEDDAAAGRADRRQHRLGDGDLGGQVDLDLAAEFLQRQRLQRARDGDAGVVDEALEAALRLGTDPLRGGGDLLGAR